MQCMVVVIFLGGVGLRGGLDAKTFAFSPALLPPIKTNILHQLELTIV
jgi:hypothetical protein